VLGVGGLYVLGSIPAGPLREILDGCENLVEDRELLPYEVGDFLLIVEGDSMIGDGIYPGDKVLLRPNVSVKEGEIAAVHVGEEYFASLKHVHFGASRSVIKLRASNPSYEDIVVAAREVRVAGVYRGLVRST